MCRFVQNNHISNPPPCGVELGVGHQVQKEFTKNCMKCVDLQRTIMFLTILLHRVYKVEVEYQKCFFLLGIA